MNMNNYNKGAKGRRKKGGGKEGGGTGSGRGRISRPQALSNTVEDIILNMDRYNLWWTGPPDTDTFKPTEWGNTHTDSNNAIFTMAVVQGQAHGDFRICSSPNDFKLYLGTARKYFDGDIVIAIDAGLTEDVKNVLIKYKAIVYELPHNLCAKETKSVFCGSADERVPASVFRYFFYEKWSMMYSTTSLIMFTDFRDIIFQGNPFTYRLDEWYPEYQLVTFQEFHPNMVINRCQFNRMIMTECYGDDTLRLLGNRVIISSGAALGTRDAILAWSHYMSTQLQEAPGRMVETRCLSGGIEHAFVNWLVYGNKLRQIMRIRTFPQGEGAVNTLGGLKPDTVIANITGNIKSFWRVLNDDGYILNWNGDVAPVVHQLDHFHEELQEIAEDLIKSKKIIMADGDESKVDLMWQATKSSRCLWGCKTLQ